MASHLGPECNLWCIAEEGNATSGCGIDPRTSLTALGRSARGAPTGIWAAERSGGGWRPSARANEEGFREEVTFKLDGQDYPRVVARDTTVSQTLADVDTLEGITKRNGTVFEDYIRTVSKDRKTMTYNTKGMNAQGQKSEIAQVFDRQ